MYIVARKKAFGHDEFFEDVPFGLCSSWVTNRNRAAIFACREAAEKYAEHFKGRVIEIGKGETSNG